MAWHATSILPCRAAEKLSLMRKKGQASNPAPAHFSTCFREIIQKNPPPVPSCLLQAATRTKDSPNVGKVDCTQIPVDLHALFYLIHWTKLGLGGGWLYHHQFFWTILILLLIILYSDTQFTIVVFKAMHITLYYISYIKVGKWVLLFHILLWLIAVN